MEDSVELATQQLITMKKTREFLFAIPVKYKVLFLIIYGIIFFIWFSETHFFSGSERIMNWRLGQMKMAIDSIFEGRHLLSGIEANGIVASIGFSDSRGMFVMVPIIAKMFGITDPLTAYAFFQKLMLFPIIAVYPIIFYLIFRSVIISILVPWIVTTFFVTFHQFTDSYWIQQWVLLIAVPILLILWKYPWRTGFLGLVIIVGLASSLAESVRSYSGLGVIISLIAIIIYKLGWKKSLMSAIPITIVSYLLISTIIINGIIAHRNKENPVFAKEDSAHPFYHSVYIGIANGKPNKYGIKYLDGYGDEQVHKVNPEARYLSSEYNSIIKGLYFDLWKSDPMFIMNNYLSKIKQLAVMGIISVKFILCLIVLLLIGRKQDNGESFIGYYLILIPPLIFGAVPGVLTIVKGNGGPYTLGYEGAAVWLWILFLFYAIKLVEKKLLR